MDEGAASSRFTFVSGGLQNAMTKGCCSPYFVCDEPTHIGIVLQRGVDIVRVDQNHRRVLAALKAQVGLEPRPKGAHFSSFGFVARQAE